MSFSADFCQASGQKDLPVWLSSSCSQKELHNYVHILRSRPRMNEGKTDVSFQGCAQHARVSGSPRMHIQVQPSKFTCTERNNAEELTRSRPALRDVKPRWRWAASVWTPAGKQRQWNTPRVSFIGTQPNLTSTHRHHWLWMSSTGRKYGRNVALWSFDFTNPD